MEKAIDEHDKKELQQKLSKPGSKLRTFAKLKTTSGMEHYATALPRRDRRIIAKLRSGAAHLEIETGRFDKIPPEARLCYHCRDKVEDEQHFLVECPKYAQERQELYQYLTDQGTPIGQMDNLNQLRFLLTRCGEFKRVIKFIRRAWSSRAKARKELGLS